MGRNPLSSAPWQPKPRDCCPSPDMISLIAMRVSEEWGRRKGGRCVGNEIEKKRCMMREVGKR